MPAVRHSRHQQARFAMWLAQPKVLFAWIIPFGALALLSFLAIFVSLLAPTFPLAWISTTTQAMSGLLLLTLLGRSVVLRQGWMPVSEHDLTHALALADQPYAVQEALLHAWKRQRWVSWSQVWAVRGRPEGFDAMFEGHAWSRRAGRADRIASLTAARAVLPLAVTRHADTMSLQPPTTTRTRHRS